MKTMHQKIQGIIDAAQSSAMSLSDADHAREIDARLDVLACEFMATRRYLTPMSLDEWLAENHDLLTQAERDDGNSILAAYF
jgi:hypothetical protein